MILRNNLCAAHAIDCFYMKSFVKFPLLSVLVAVFPLFVVMVFAETVADPAVDTISDDFSEKPGACIEGSCYATIREALDKAKDNDTVTLEPGIYQQAGVLVANGVTIMGTGAHLAGVAAEGKAALVIKGDDATILGLEISNVRVPDGNGAAVRQEGRNLILKNVHFHDNEMGILTGKGTGTLLVEDSVIENNGYEGSNLGHNIYAQGETLKFIRSRSLRARNGGHEIKSRAHRTIIYDSIIASLGSRDSRCIDIPNGGDILISKSIIQKGPNSTNREMIGLALENVIKHSLMTALIEYNTMIFDTSRLGEVVEYEDMNSVIITGNTIVASWNPNLPGNNWFPTRRSAGLPEYPALLMRSSE